MDEVQPPVHQDSELPDAAAPQLDDLDTLVPLSHLVIEGLGADITALVKKVGDDDIFLDSIGRRCVTEARAAALFSERAAQQARERARREAYRKEVAAKNTARLEADRRRMERIAELQEKQGGGLIGRGPRS